MLRRRLGGPHGEVVPHDAHPHCLARARGLRVRKDSRGKGRDIGVGHRWYPRVDYPGGCTARAMIADGNVLTEWASVAPPCDKGLGPGEVVRRGAKTWQGERVKGGRARVEERGAGDTRRARVSGNERDARGKKGKMQARTRDTTARRDRTAGGEQRQSGAPHCIQSDAMPMTCIDPYRPPRPTIRELMEGRPAGEDDGGIPRRGTC